MRSRFVLTGAPRAFARTATDQGGRRRTPAGYRDWKDAAAGKINLTRGGRSHTGEVIAEISVHSDGMVVTFTDSNPSKSRPRGVTGDLDNYIKAALDAAQQGNVIGDDRQISKIEARFVPGPIPTMEGTK